MEKVTKEKVINAKLFEQMVYGGVYNLQKNLQIVNDLNVFPIPDGDTGENMYATIKSGLDELKKENSDLLCKKASAMANGMLLGARGNSGVILSQLFFGLSEGLNGLETATLKEFGLALNKGVSYAYKAVSHPVEGTILTVAREAAENANGKTHETMSVEDFFGVYLREMKLSLQRTPDLLAVLKEAGVIDSGGAGLVYIIEGFCCALGGEIEDEIAVTETEAKPTLDFSKFNEHSEMEFGYCTELLLQLQHRKTDIDNFSIEKLKEYLNSIGDSVVTFQTGTIVKIHVHTREPNLVLGYALQFGEFLTVKIENMTLQHNETLGMEKKKPKRERRKYATISVASGDGLISLFKEMGADYVISGGQTHNPSSEDFIRAFDEVNADYIFVLPNNGNIVLTAKQAAKIYDKSDVRIIESKSEGEGYAALSMLDYSCDNTDEIENQFKEDIQDITSAMVAKSVRDTTLNGVTVQKDEYMGYTGKQLYVARKEKTDALCALIDDIDKTGKYCIIVVYGKSVTEKEKMAVQEFIKNKYSSMEFYEIDGKQDVHDFLLFLQ
ncbi:MAG: DAK2 domain-containing protein [Clostridia bacterium]|nr:DAK2 domain-containing protein [Clostridia bacterium]